MTLYKVLGRLVAEFLGDNVVGLVRVPGGPVIGYDFSFIPKFRNGLAEAVFNEGPPERVMKGEQDDVRLLQATAEAKRRWPEFLAAFAARKPKQGFGVKKKFQDQSGVEHMWVEVQRIDGSTINGKLANTPDIIKSMKLGDNVILTDSEVDDWVFMRGAETVGLFQAAVMRPQ